jgi:hypothetical protein
MENYARNIQTTKNSNTGMYLILKEYSLSGSSPLKLHWRKKKKKRN